MGETFCEYLSVQMISVSGGSVCPGTLWLVLMQHRVLIYNTLSSGCFQVTVWKVLDNVKNTQFHFGTFCENKSDDPKPLGFVSVDWWLVWKATVMSSWTPRRKMCFSCTQGTLGKTEPGQRTDFLILGFFHLFVCCQCLYFHLLNCVLLLGSWRC